MKTVTPEVEKALRAIQNVPGANYFVEWVEESFEDNVQQLIDASPADVGVFQGKCRVLREVKETIRAARRTSES